MKSGAESGWDYSTKWFFNTDGTPSLNLNDVQTRHIIPVELNSYLCKNARILQNFYMLLGNEKKSKEYSARVDDFKSAIHDVLWNGTKGAYFDYKIQHNEQNIEFYPSNLSPLWANCFK